MLWIRCSRRRCFAIAERRRVGWRGQIVQPHERQLRHQTCRETRSLVPSVCCADTQLRTRKMTNDSRVFGSTQAMFPRNSVFAWLGPVFFFRIHRSLGIGFCMLLLLSVCRLMISDCKCTRVFGTDIWCGQRSRFGSCNDFWFMDHSNSQLLAVGHFGMPNWTAQTKSSNSIARIPLLFNQASICVTRQ